MSDSITMKEALMMDIRDLQKENEEQARLLAMSADREEKLRAALQRITECDMRWSKKVAREALQ